MMLDQALEIVSGLSWLTIPLGLGGFFLTVYLMMLMGHVQEDVRDPIWIQWCRRFSYSVIAFGMIWSLRYQLDKGWHPWPPEIVLMFGLIIMMSLKVVVIHRRLNKERRSNHVLPNTHFHGPGLTRSKR